jgi:hypothetical protein
MSAYRMEDISNFYINLINQNILVKWIEEIVITDVYITFFFQ